ncbi:Hemicentin-1 [Anas platyrhynchos]|uniref:Hemicentin-1 n=1 Tax=Anas platyrhynchos TaxID=8839 RepID=R0KJW7_ANAPL|nr:Hemicentin-1 [Anas platyrhynchos]
MSALPRLCAGSSRNVSLGQAVHGLWGCQVRLRHVLLFCADWAGFIWMVPCHCSAYNDMANTMSKADASRVLNGNCCWVVFSEIGPVTITTDPKKFQFELRELYVQVKFLLSWCWSVLLESSAAGLRSLRICASNCDLLGLLRTTGAINLPVSKGACKQISKGSGLNELLNIHNSAKVVNVKDPEPGTWTIKTSSSGRHSVRITGLSTIDFRAGFSKKPTLDFKKTSSRPVQGIPTFVLLNTTGILLPARVDRLELLSITGELLKTLPVKYYPDRKPYGLWNISDFIPPDEAFFVKIMGYDKDDYLFQRVSSVSFSSITPDAPKVTMPSKTPGYYLQPGSVPCHVESLIPFTQRFTKNGVKLGEDQFFKESSSMSWEIDQVSLSDEGFYECIATSSAGTGRAQTFLDVSEPPPIIQVPNNITAVPGEAAILTCLTLSTVRYNLTWQRNGRDVRLKEPLRIRVLSNLSLEVKTVKFTDAGKYNCIASNEGGSTTASVFLTVQGDLELRPSAFLIIDSHRGLLKIQETQDLDAGDYTCVATNDAGTASAKITLDVGYLWVSDEGTYICEAENQFGRIQSQPATITVTGLVTPLIGISPDTANVIEGQQLTLPCVLLAGNPIPDRRWIRNSMVLVPNPYINVRSDGSLHLERVRLQDGGDYTCMASNVAGTNNKTTTVNVYGPCSVIKDWRVEEEEVTGQRQLEGSENRLKIPNPCCL